MNRNHGEELRRSLSVVFKNIPVLDSNDPVERHEEDCLTIRDIIAWLGIDDYISDDCIRRTRNGGYIMVTMMSQTSKNLLLKRKKWLQTEHQLKNIFIEPAHSWAQVQQRFRRN